MDEQDRENLEQLYERFVGSEEARQAAADIRKGEQVLDEYPAPEPGDKLVADIKVRGNRALRQRKSDTFVQIAYKAAAVAAAAVIILAVISAELFKQDSGERGEVSAASIIPAAIWEGEDIAVDDAELATLIDEVEEIEGEILALQLGEESDNDVGQITEVQTELIEVNGNFWKG